jgi:hypothetical protein
MRPGVPGAARGWCWRSHRGTRGCFPGYGHRLPCVRSFCSQRHRGGGGGAQSSSVPPRSELVVAARASRCCSRMCGTEGEPPHPGPRAQQTKTPRAQPTQTPRAPLTKRPRAQLTNTPAFGVHRVIERVAPPGASGIDSGTPLRTVGTALVAYDASQPDRTCDEREWLTLDAATMEWRQRGFGAGSFRFQPGYALAAAPFV